MDTAIRQRTVEVLGEALVEYGFVAVENHGVDAAALGQTYTSIREFFALPTASKSKYELRRFGRQRGYTPFGKEKAKDASLGDMKEFWHVGPEFAPGDPLHGRIPGNVWPTETPEFKPAALALWQSLHSCGGLLLRGIAEYLGAPTDTFDQMTTGGNSVLRLIRYPETPPEATDEDAVWAAAHEDINLITLLVEATDPGLELLTRQGDWLPIMPVPGQLIMDTGDMMQRLTNGKIPATTHRVRMPEVVEGPRYSIPFFIHPHPDASLRVLDCCASPEDDRTVDALSAEEYLAERLRDNGVLTVDIDVDWLSGQTIDEDLE
jgi:isopenicillin N synthase-like dioxygenase